MHHLWALGSLRRFLSLSPIFWDAFLSGVTTFENFWNKIEIKKYYFKHLLKKKKKALKFDGQCRNLALVSNLLVPYQPIGCCLYLRCNSDPLAPTRGSGRETLLRRFLFISEQTAPLWAPCWLQEQKLSTYQPEVI